jgi:hypothetical protein
MSTHAFINGHFIMSKHGKINARLLNVLFMLSIYISISCTQVRKAEAEQSNHGFDIESLFKEALALKLHSYLDN